MRYIFLMLFLLVNSAWAGISINKPDDLNNWKNWFVDGTNFYCPSVDGSSEKLCMGYKDLNLYISSVDSSYRFSLSVKVFKKSVIPLLGNELSWPQNVLVNNKPAVIVNNGNIPYIVLDRGDWDISGFLPKSIERDTRVLIPSLYYYFKVHQNNEEVLVKRPDDGFFWVSSFKNKENKAVEDIQKEKDVSPKIEVFRLFKDGIPAELETRIGFTVPQENREFVFRDYNGWELTNVKADFPIKKTKEGEYILQLPKGKWSMSYSQRFGNGTPPNLQINKENTVQNEFISIMHQPLIRSVSIVGADIVDAKHLNIPPEWALYPTYQLMPNKVLQFKEEHRGKVIKDDALNLQRVIKLNFSGEGAVIRDRITGRLNSNKRLESANDYNLTQFEQNGEGVPITVWNKGVGLDLLAGEQNLVSYSTVDNFTNISASGWNTGFHNSEIILDVPPGFRLLWVDGDLDAPDSWISKWDLYDVFLLIISGFAIFKMLGLRWALFSVILLGSLYHEVVRHLGFFGLVGIWLNIIIAYTLWASLKEGSSFKSGVKIYTIASYALLGLLIIFFAQQLIFSAMNPLLSGDGYFSIGENQRFNSYRSGFSSSVFSIFSIGLYIIGFGLLIKSVLSLIGFKQSKTYFKKAIGLAILAAVVLSFPSFFNDIGVGSGGGNYNTPPEVQEMASGFDSAGEGAPQESLAMSDSVISKSMVSEEASKRRSAPLLKENKQYNTNDAFGFKVSVGSGFPEWNWQRYRLASNGRLVENSKISLIYSNQNQQYIISFFWILGLILLFRKFIKKHCLLFSDVDVILDRVKQMTKSFNGGKLSSWFVAVLFVGLTIGQSDNALAMQKSEPHIASDVAENIPSQSSNSIIDEYRDRLFKAKECAPHCGSVEKISLTENNGSLIISSLVHADGDLWISIPEGADSYKVNGSDAVLMYAGGLKLFIPSGVSTIQLTKNMREGFHFNNGFFASAFVDNKLKNIKFTKSATEFSFELGEAIGVEVGKGELSKESVEIKPFFTFRRKIVFESNSWKVINTLEKKYGSFSNNIFISLPLLSNEKVIDERYKVENGLLVIPFLSSDKEVSWLSDLNLVSQMELKHPQNNLYSEIWEFEKNPLWHIEYKGIPEVSDNLFIPLPNEKLSILIDKLKSIDGAHIGIQSFKESIVSGNKLTSYLIQVEVMAGLPDVFTYKMPPAAILGEVSVNGAPFQPMVDKDTVKINLNTGINKISIGFDSPEEMSVKFSPTSNLNYPGSNFNASMQIQQDRWVLWVGGDVYKPSVLFWSFFILLLLVTFVAAKFNPSVKMYEWFILGIGLSQLSWIPILIVFAAIYSIGIRKSINPSNLDDSSFNMIQSLIIGITLVALMIVFVAINQGLLGYPDMLIRGLSSNAFNLNWYGDRWDANALPQVFVLSVPLYVYRIIMLIWSLWMAMFLFKIAKEWWTAFSLGGYWKSPKDRVAHGVLGEVEDSVECDEADSSNNTSDSSPSSAVSQIEEKPDRRWGE